MTGGLQPYPEYKDAGLPWLGQIPAHWEVRRNGRLFAQRNETGYGDLPILEVSLRTGVRVRDMNDLKRKQVMSDRDKYKRAAKGDVAYNMMRMWQGAVGVAPEDGLISPAYVVARPREETEPRYFSYLFRTDAYKNEVDGYSRGIVKDRNRLYWEDFKRMPSCSPPPDEQKAIADYLDANAVKVRRFIRNRRRLIEVLSEQKQAIINRAVTRGLDPNAPLKPSGIDCLDDVPKHWVSTKLASRYDQCLGKMVDAKRFTGEHSVPYLRNTDVQWDRVNIEGLPLIDISPHERERFTVRPGDLLVCEGGDVGRCAFWRGELETCGFQKALHRLRPLSCDTDYPRFLYYCMYNASKLGVFLADGSENTIAHLTGVKLRAHRFAFPPKEEQQRIADFLDDAVAEADGAIGVATREIDLIREYRTRLIADVVTGKVDVRSAANAMETKRQVVAKRAFTPELAVAALDAEIVARFNVDGRLHRVRRHKATCLAYHHAQLAPVNPQFVRDAAGPRDLNLIDAANREAEHQQWFREDARQGSYHYKALPKIETRRHVLRDLWADRLHRIEEVLQFLDRKPRQTCENLATLYMAWNDLLIWKQEPTDDAIIEEVIQFWPGKDAILEATWRSDLRQLRASALHPTGFGVPTRERGLFEGARP